jgi:protein O-mannosyl-transferase
MSQKKIKKLRALQKVEEIKKVEVETKEEVKEGFFDIITKNWKFLLFLLIGVVLIYLNSLNGNFVSDDYATITQNPDILNFSVMTKGLNSMFISNYLLALFFGIENPFSFHLFSLILFLILLVLVFGVIYKIFGKKTAIFTIILFAFSPINVEVVSWISGRIYTLLAIYIMLGFMAFINYLETGKGKYLFYWSLFFVLTFWTDKPRSFTFFFLIILFIFYKSFVKYKERVNKIKPYLISVFILHVFLAIPYITNRTNVVNSGTNFSDSIFYNPFFQYPTGIAKYLQLIVFPVDLTLYHTMYVLPVFLNWMIILTFLGLIVYFWGRDKRYFFALTFFLVVLAPSMAPVKVSWLVAERYAVLPSLGIFLFIGLLLERLDKKVKNLPYVILFLIIPFMAWRIYLRNDDWQTNHKLWVRTVQYSHNSHNAWNNIGDDYDKLEDYENSIKGFGMSYKTKENYADAYHNQANIYFKIERYDLARNGYETALALNPSLYQSYISLVQVALAQKDIEGALVYANELLKAQPNNPQAHHVRGYVDLMQDKTDEATAYFQNALKLDPNYAPAINMLNQIQAEKNNPRQLPPKDK